MTQHRYHFYVAALLQPICLNKNYALEVVFLGTQPTSKKLRQDILSCMLKIDQAKNWSRLIASGEIGTFRRIFAR